MLKNFSPNLDIFFEVIIFLVEKKMNCMKSRRDIHEDLKNR
jgi:hypothetical protein